MWYDQNGLAKCVKKSELRNTIPEYNKMRHSNTMLIEFQYKKPSLFVIEK